MKILMGLIVALTLATGTVSAQTAYQDDKTDFYVENQTNESLSFVNMLLCYMAAMAPDKMVNAGIYVASIYDSECEEEDTSASDQKAATATSAQSASSSSGESGGGGADKTGKTAEQNTVVSTRADNDSPMKIKAWVKSPSEEEDGFTMPGMVIYVEGIQSAAPSEASKFGNFVMNMTYSLTDAWNGMEAGANMGGGYLKADGNTVIFRNETMRSAPEALKATFSSTGVSGVFNSESWVGGFEGFPAQLTSKFAIDDTSKVYCQELLEAKKVSMESFDENGFPTLSAYTPVSGDGLATSEVCWSTALADAKQNVHRYGVYKQDGSRLELGQSGFPMKGAVTIAGESVDVHAYADYWGVWFDDRFSSAVNLIGTSSPTTFTKENFAGESGTKTYQIRQSNARIEKISKSYVSLNSLDKMTAVMWVDKWDTNWASKYDTLGFTGDSAEYSGTYDASSGTWTFDKKITFTAGYNETALSTPISFNNQKWLDTMKETYSDSFVHTRALWVWSPDTGSAYDISKKSLANPADATATNGISMNSRESLTPANYPSSVFCVEQCPTAALLNATVQAAAGASSRGTKVASPYNANNWQVLKNGENAGRFQDGILATNVQTYTTSGLKVLDSTSTEIMFPISIVNPSEQLKSSVFAMPWGDGEQLEWGVGTGRLLASQADLDSIECEKNAAGAYRNTHAEFDASAKRYCPGMLDRPDSTVTTWYEIRFGAQPWDRTKYVVDQSTSLDVVFSAPTTLYYTVPNEAKYSEDKGKTVRLDYNGFGELHGIPGHVVDTQTGESLGKYFSGDWKEYYRYVSRFIIENDALGNEPTVKTGGASPVTYKVKALQGEEWLGLKASAKGTLNYSSAAASDLPGRDVLTDVSPNGTGGGIGAEPTTGLINGGKPAVIHEEVVFTAGGI